MRSCAFVVFVPVEAKPKILHKEKCIMCAFEGASSLDVSLPSQIMTNTLRYVLICVVVVGFQYANAIFISRSP